MDTVVVNNQYVSGMANESSCDKDLYRKKK